MAKRLRSSLLFLALIFTAAPLSAAQSGWEAEWEKTIAAAEKEGQITIYAPPGKQYQDAVTTFSQYYPKIKLTYVPGSGSNNAQKLMAERRAGKYLADVFIGGSGTLIEVLFAGKVLDPMPPHFILPEVKDPSGWFDKKHTFADADGQYVLQIQASVQRDVGAYNTKLVNAGEIKSFWDVLQPKWKGKMAAFDPRDRGHIQRMRALYYNSNLGPEFLRRLFEETDVTLGRDQRQLLDWVASGKFQIYLFATDSDVEDAKKQGLPVGILYGQPKEGYISGQFGHIALVKQMPHPNTANLFLNWVLSRQGQTEWQKKTDNNSLRTDIPKDMLSDQSEIPKAGEKYLNARLPQYQDVKPVLKILETALAKTGK